MSRFFQLLILLPLSLFGQSMLNSVGVVTISEKYDNTDHIIEFLNDDGTTWYTLNLYEEWKNKPDFQIIAFKPDYFLFKIKCKGKTPDVFKVVVNEETGLTKTIANSNKVKFVTWEEYVLNIFSIDFNPTELLIYDQIGGTAISELPKRGVMMVPKKLKGDWMQIIWSNTNNYPINTSKDRTGWIRWRKDNRIIVTIYHSS